MKAFLRMHYRLLISVIAGVIAGSSIWVAVKKQNNQSDEIVSVDHIGVQSVLPDTQIQCIYRFTGCDHTIEQSIESMPHVGQTRESLLSEFNDADLKKFTKEFVQLQRLRNGPCPNHIMLRADESGQLHIYKTSSDTLEINSIQKLTIYAGSFQSEVTEELYEGIVFDTVDEVNAYLESAES